MHDAIRRRRQHRQPLGEREHPLRERVHGRMLAMLRVVLERRAQRVQMQRRVVDAEACVLEHIVEIGERAVKSSEDPAGFGGLRHFCDRVARDAVDVREHSPHGSVVAMHPQRAVGATPQPGRNETARRKVRRNHVDVVIDFGREDLVDLLQHEALARARARVPRAVDEPARRGFERRGLKIERRESGRIRNRSGGYGHHSASYNLDAPLQLHVELREDSSGAVGAGLVREHAVATQPIVLAHLGA